MTFNRFTIIVAFTLGIFGCTKEKIEVSSEIQKSNLINKIWIVKGTEVRFDGNTYTNDKEPTTLNSTMVYLENGEYIITDIVGFQQKGKWELIGDTLKDITYSVAFKTRIANLNSKILKVYLGENLDATKSPENFSKETNFEAYSIGYFILKKYGVDIEKAKNRQMDVLQVMKVQ